MTPNKKARQGDDLAGLKNNFSPANHTAQHGVAAHAVLRDSITAANVEPFLGMALLAAAELYAKACMRDQFAALVMELERGSGGAE